jgi:predicted carbohydrate-binding protein with CBM5 and CBM33 domain
MVVVMITTIVVWQLATSNNGSFYNCDGDSVNNNNGGWYEDSNIGRICTTIYSLMDYEFEIFKY